MRAQATPMVRSQRRTGAGSSVMRVRLARARSPSVSKTMVGTRAPLCGEGVSVGIFETLGMASGGSRFDATDSAAGVHSRQRPRAVAAAQSPQQLRGQQRAADSGQQAARDQGEGSASRSPTPVQRARRDMPCQCQLCLTIMRRPQILRRRPRQIGRADRDRARRPMPAGGRIHCRGRPLHRPHGSRSTAGRRSHAASSLASHTQGTASQACLRQS